MSTGKRKASFKGTHGVRRGQYWTVLYYDDNGKRREHRTRIATSEPEQVINAYIYENFTAKNHKPAFGSGDPAQVKIVTCLHEYLNVKKEEAEHNKTLTIWNIEVSIRNLMEFALEKFVAQWDQQQTDRYVEWRINRGDLRGSNNRGGKPLARKLTTTTASTDLIALRAAFNHCVKKGLLAKAPIIKLPFRPTNRHPRHLTIDEFTLLMWSALGFDRYGNRRFRPHYGLARFLLIGVFTGTRADRICRLQIRENHLGGWVDLDKGLLHRKAKHEPVTKKRAPTVALPPWPTPDAKRNKLRARS